MRIDYVRMPELANKTPAEAFSPASSVQNGKSFVMVVMEHKCSEASGSWQRKSGKQG